MRTLFFAITLAALYLVTALMLMASQPDSVKDIKKNPAGWEEWQYYENGVLVESIWGYEKANGKWKLVKKTAEGYVVEDDAKKPKKVKK